MTRYAAPTSVRSNQLKPNDLVRVNKVPMAERELKIWAAVLEVSPWQENPGAPVSIQLAGGFKFVAEADQLFYCRVSVDH